MENYPFPPFVYGGVPVKPDKEEKKRIRGRYLRVGAVILFNMLLFNYVLTGILIFTGSFFGEGETMRARASDWLRGNAALTTVASCLLPIISETASILLGMKLLKINFKSLFKFDGFTGKELTNSMIVSLGLQTLSALIAAVVGALLKVLGFESATAELNATSSAGASVFMYFYACLLGPVLEELLYRGIVLQGLRKYNERFAIIISALIFGLMHQNYAQFILGFTVGLVLAAADLRAESLIPSTIIHIVMNTSGVFFMLIMEAADYDAFTGLLSDSSGFDITLMSGGFLFAAIINALFRYGMLFAGIVLIIISMVKGGSVKRPTPAGKSRGWPVLATSWIWYIIFFGYIYLAFIEPMKFVG